jgi:hypothetical protein
MTHVHELQPFGGANRTVHTLQNGGQTSIEGDETFGVADPVVGWEAPTRLLRAEFVTASKRSQRRSR